MNILVTFAVDWEFRPWQKLRAFHQVPGRSEFHHAQVAGNSVTVALTGVGAQNAVRTLRACPTAAPEVCVVSGLAGGLTPEYRSGEILVARAVRRQLSDQVLASNEQLFNLAVGCGAKPAQGFISASHVVRTAAEKAELGRFADAVEMESFAIMEEMQRASVPCVAIRSVADEVALDLACDFGRTLDARGRVRILKVLEQVAQSPRQLWPLAKFGIASSQAAGALARYLDSFLQVLAEQRVLADAAVG